MIESIWQKIYVPPHSSKWQGRADTPENSAIFQIVKKHDLRAHNFPQTSKRTYGLIGFCCDEGVRRNLGRIGAFEGPNALRQSLAKLPVHNGNFDLYDFGDVICENGDLEFSQCALGDIVEILILQGITPIVIGGGHEVAFGHYQGIVKSFPQKKLGIINFDAHLDMRPMLTNNQGSSGTPFLQMAWHSTQSGRNFDYNCIGVQKTGNLPQLFTTARKYNVNTIHAEELHQTESKNFFPFIDRIIEENDHLYMTICLDVFSSAYAPGVSAIQPLGLSPWQVIPLVRKLMNSGKVVSYDIAELNPRYDTDDRTAKLAANLIYDILNYEKKD